ncbi:MCE family protein, partial [Aduncisulcus paluster]
MSMNEVAAQMGQYVQHRKKSEMAPDVLAETNATLVTFRNEWKKLAGAGAGAMDNGSKNITVLTNELIDILQKVETAIATLQKDMSFTLGGVGADVT